MDKKLRREEKKERKRNVYISRNVFFEKRKSGFNESIKGTRWEKFFHIYVSNLNTGLKGICITSIRSSDQGSSSGKKYSRF